MFIFVAISSANANDNGQYPDNGLKPWFDSLRNSDGNLCCSVADGKALAVDDWGTHEDHYWVIIDGMRYAVPPEAIVTVPNKFGQAVVWPFKAMDGTIHIRCFIPGAGT